MSVDLLVSVLDLERFEQTYGSKNQELLSAILAAKRREIADHDAYFRDWADPGRYDSIVLAISGIINGNTAALEPLFQFEHAAVMIADYMGEPLESDPLMEAREDFWDEVRLAIQHCRTTLRTPAEIWPTLDDILSRGPLLDIPLAPIRLGSGYLTSAEVRTADETLPDSTAACESDLGALTWPDEALEAVEAYRGWLRAAADVGHGLFFHH